MLRALLLPPALLLLTGLELPRSPRPSAPAEPRAIVRQALRAVEGDSAPALAAQWTARLDSQPGDRVAALGLATIARLQYRYEEADRRYSDLASAPGHARDAVTTYALLGHAWGLDLRGLAPRADTAFTRARSQARERGDRVAEAEALIGLSVNRGSQQGVKVGIALLDTAGRLLPATALDLRADVALRRALFATVLSRPRAARDALAAAALAHDAGEPRLQARALRALALGLELGGQLDSAGVVLLEVERLERGAHDRATLAESLMRHADVFHNRGDIGPYKAYALASHAEALASGNLYALAASNIALGSIGLMLNDYATASDRLAEAAVLYDTMQDRSGFALVQAYQADLAVGVGELTRARQLAEAARDFDRTIGDPEEVEEWRDLIAINIRLGDLSAAGNALAAAEALAHVRHQPAWDASLDLDRARLALARGDPAAAVTALTRELTTLDTAEHVGRYGSRTLLAEAEARNGQLAHAELELTAAADELDAWRATITDRALRPYVFQANAREVNDRDASAATVLAAMAAGGRADAAFALAERRRARDLADRLIQLAALRAGPVGDSEVDGSALGVGTETVAGDVVLRPGGDRGTADSIAAALPDAHTALLEFVTGARGAPTTLFVVTRPSGVGGIGVGRASLSAYVLPSADSLAPSIARYVALLESGQEAGGLARSIAAVTLDSALGALGPGITRLVIVPDGPLHRLPFDALRSADDTPLVERYTVSVAPSAAALRALWRQSLAARPDLRPVQLLALADPTFALSDTTTAVDRDMYRGAFDSTGRLPRLAESAREARIVARYAPYAVVRLGPDASAAYLKHAPLEGYRVIHIATHALVDDRSLARTALALAPGGGESGYVTASDVAALRLRADVVVLSACRTAGGVVIDGEGVQGLTGSVLAAGGRSVVATQWRIHDRAIVPLVRSFYDGLAHGLPVADALRAAKRQAIANGTSAADWAAFTVVGDPLARVPLRVPMVARLTTAGWVVAMLAALVVLGAAARYAQLRRRGAAAAPERP
jgi:CHAT domain